MGAAGRSPAVRRVSTLSSRTGSKIWMAMPRSIAGVHSSAYRNSALVRTARQLIFIGSDGNLGMPACPAAAAAHRDQPSAPAHSSRGCTRQRSA